MVLNDAVPISDEEYFVIPDVPQNSFTDSKKQRPNFDVFLDISPQEHTQKTEW